MTPLKAFTFGAVCSQCKKETVVRSTSLEGVSELAQAEGFVRSHSDDGPITGWYWLCKECAHEA